MSFLTRLVLRLVAFCANGCGTPVPADQVMCTACGGFSRAGGVR